MEFPRNSKNFSQSEPGVVEAAERVADQRNLYNETKFTSSLFRPRISSKAALTSSEKRFHDMLKAEEETKKLEPPKEEAPADPEQWASVHDMFPSVILFAIIQTVDKLVNNQALLKGN